MKRFTCPIGRTAELHNGTHPTLKLEHPERTARRAGVGVFADDVYQVWPNRASMARTIRMQECGKNFVKAWKAVIPLLPGEGY